MDSTVYYSLRITNFNFILSKINNVVYNSVYTIKSDLNENTVVNKKLFSLVPTALI